MPGVVPGGDAESRGALRAAPGDVLFLGDEGPGAAPTGPRVVRQSPFRWHLPARSQLKWACAVTALPGAPRGAFVRSRGRWARNRLISRNRGGRALVWGPCFDSSNTGRVERGGGSFARGSCRGR